MTRYSDYFVGPSQQVSPTATTPLVLNARLPAQTFTLNDQPLQARFGPLLAAIRLQPSYPSSYGNRWGDFDRSLNLFPFCGVSSPSMG